MRHSLASFVGIGVLLVGTIVFDLTSSGTKGGMSIGALPKPSELFTQAAPFSTPVVNWQVLTNGILARPLFAATRRPDVPMTSPPQLPASLPRLAGIVMVGHSRSAIFAAVGEGRPVVVQENARIGDQIVQSIEIGQITLSGPKGQQILRPTFGPTAASKPATVPCKTYSNGTTCR